MKLRYLNFKLSNLIQSDGLFVSSLANLGKKSTKKSISLSRDNIPGLISNLTPNAIDKFDRKISGKEVIRAGKGYALFISN